MTCRRHDTAGGTELMVWYVPCPPMLPSHAPLLTFAESGMNHMATARRLRAASRQSGLGFEGMRSGPTEFLAFPFTVEEQVKDETYVSL
jgi:hypothetical protein